MNKNDFIHGALIITCTNLIIRIFSFSYEVFLCQKIGAEAIGIFYMIMPVLMIALAITTSGLPIAISKMASREYLNHDHYLIKRTIKISLFFIILLTIVVSMVLTLKSENICLILFNDLKYKSSIILLIPAIILISTGSLLRGLLYGLNCMISASVSQFIEHLSRFIIVFILMSTLLHRFNDNIANIAIIGISSGEAFSLIYLIFVYHHKFRYTPYKTKKTSNFAILKQLLKTTAPLTFLGIINLSQQFLIAIVLPKKLVESGLTQQAATETFGRIMGMAMPVIFLPFIFTSALVITIIPSITRQLHQKRMEALHKDKRSVICITLIITLPVSAIYTTFGGKIGFLLYKDLIAGRYIQILGLSTLTLSLQQILSGILYGLGKERSVAVNHLIGTLIQLIAIFYLVGNPRYHVYGFFAGFNASSVITCLLDTWLLNRANPD